MKLIFQIDSHIIPKSAKRRDETSHGNLQSVVLSLQARSLPKHQATILCVLSSFLALIAIIVFTTIRLSL